LSFEVHRQTGLGLDAVLAQDAAAAPGALPLLSFTLDELYKHTKSRGEAVLTHASYEGLGGLEGAIANRADETVRGLPAAAQAELPRVLRALTTVSGASDRAPVARSIPLDTFAKNSPARTLIDAFVAARLLVAAGESGAAPTTRLAHEALIGRWQRARDQLSADRRDLETRSLVERELARWNRARGRERRLLLLHNPDLANAVDLARRWGDEIDVETRTFIRVSQQRARRQQQMAMAAVVIFFLVAVGAGAAAVLAFRQQHLADQQRDRAVTTNSRLLAARAFDAVSDGDAQTAILLSLEAMRPPDDVGPDHYELEVEKALLVALSLNPLRSILRAVGTKYSDAAFGYDGSILAAIGANGSASFWKVDAGAHALTRTQLAIPLGPVMAVVANPARPIFLFRGKDGLFFAWNFQTQQVVPGVTGTCTETETPGGLRAGWGPQFRFSTTGERLFVYCTDVRIFDLDTGQVVQPPGTFDRFSVSPSGREFAVSKGRAVIVMDGRMGNELTSWQQDDAIQGLAMSHDGKTVLIHNYQGVQFHDSRSGGVSQPPMRTSQARTVDLYVSSKESIFATDGDDGRKVWNAARAAPIQVVSGEVVGFLPNGLLVAGTKQKITLWEYPTEGHTGTKFPVDRADLYLEQGHAFVTSSADGKIIVTLTEGGDLYIWSTDPAMLRRAVSDKGERLGTPVAFSRDGKTIATSSRSGVTIWDAATLTATNHLSLGQKPAALALSADGRLLVHIDSKGNYDILDARTLRSLKSAALPDRIATAAFSADDEKLALGFEKRISLWRVVDGSNLRQCDATDVIGKLVWTDDGTLTYATDVGTIGILIPDPCSFRQIFSFNPDRFNQIVSPNLDRPIRSRVADVRAKQRLILANLQDEVQVWSESESKQIFHATSADWPVLSRAATTLFEVLPGRRIIVGKDFDHFLRIYELDTKNQIWGFPADTNDCCMPVGMVVLPGAESLVTLWSERGAFRLRTWRLLPTIDAATEYAKSIVAECLSPQSRKDLGLQPEPAPWCIEMEKRPYGSKIWKLWLKDRMMGIASPSPAPLIQEKTKLKELASRLIQGGSVMRARRTRWCRIGSRAWSRSPPDGRRAEYRFLAGQSARTWRWVSK
jgi:WD40 repeat protein